MYFFLKNNLAPKISFSKTVLNILYILAKENLVVS